MADIASFWERIGFRRAGGVAEAGWGRTLAAALISLIYFLPVLFIIFTAFKPQELALSVPPTLSPTSLFGLIPDPSISGTVTASNGGAPLADVTLTLTGTSGGAATTSGAGTYTFSPLTANGTYTVTPSKTGFTFAPASRTFANILGAQTADFVGSAVSSTPTFTISGQVRDLNDTGVAGVTLTGNTTWSP